MLNEHSCVEPMVKTSECMKVRRVTIQNGLEIVSEVHTTHRGRKRKKKTEKAQNDIDNTCSVQEQIAFSSIGGANGLQKLSS